MRSNYIFLISLFAFAPLAVSAQVVINEIMYDAPDPGGDSGREWVEIYNVGGSAVDLSGWKLFEGDTNHNLVIAQGNNMLPVGGFAVVADKPDKFLAEHVGFSGTLFDSTFSLNNTIGEKLVLKNASSTIINEIAYTPAWGAKGDGNSLQYFSDGWKAAPPTPGTMNVKAIPKPVVVSEVKVAPPAAVPIKKMSTPDTPVQQKEDVSQRPDNVTSSLATVVSASNPESQSKFIWWFLLGGVIIIASLAYWVGGRADPDEFTIIEDRSE